MKYSRGFALPTVLIVSVILLMLLTTGISATVAVNNGLRDQYYTRLASLASDAGTAFASACFTSAGNQITWDDDNPLRPNTDCSGVINGALPEYVLDQDGIRTYFTVGADMQAKGYTEGVRETTDLAWRVWTTGSANAVQVPTSTAPVGSIISMAWTTSQTTPPDGYLWADGQCVSRTTYAALYAKIGTAYNYSRSAYGLPICAPTDFPLPSTDGRTLVDYATGTPMDNVGEMYGEYNHTQTVAELPNHTHQVPWINNGTDISDYLGGSGAAYGISPSWAGRGGAYNVLEPVGGGAAFNVVQPSIVVRMAIKV